MNSAFSLALLEAHQLAGRVKARAGTPSQEERESPLATARRRAQEEERLREHERALAEMAREVPEEREFLLDLMAKPADAAAIARLPRTKEQAAELYVASRVAMGDVNTPEEKAYLDRLTALLDLPGDLVAHLDTQVDAARKTIAS